MPDFFPSFVFCRLRGGYGRGGLLHLSTCRILQRQGYFFSLSILQPQSSVRTSYINFRLFPSDRNRDAGGWKIQKRNTFIACYPAAASLSPFFGTGANTPAVEAGNQYLHFLLLLTFCPLWRQSSSSSKDPLYEIGSEKRDFLVWQKKGGVGTRRKGRGYTVSSTPDGPPSVDRRRRGRKGEEALNPRYYVRTEDCCCRQRKPTLLRRIMCVCVGSVRQGASLRTFVARWAREGRWNGGIAHTFGSSLYREDGNKTVVGRTAAALVAPPCRVRLELETIGGIRQLIKVEFSQYMS